jgi:lipoate-protein ligase B
MPSSESLVVCHLGRVAYEPTWTLQEQIQERLIAAKREPPAESADASDHADSANRPPHVLLLLEHPPVYTLGKSGDADHLLASAETLDGMGATFHRVGRGGDVTYHGPGQLVGYPLFDLDRFFTDLGRYLRTLEEVITRTCAEYDVTGSRVDGRTGVWVGPDERGLERKICAMGVRCSRWVTMHGFAFNVTTNLAHFDHIVPCGIDDRGVTSLAEETDASVEVDDVRAPVTQHVADLFGADVTELRGEDAHAFLYDLAGTQVVPA